MVSDPSPVRTAGADPQSESETESEAVSEPEPETESTTEADEPALERDRTESGRPFHRRCPNPDPIRGRPAAEPNADAASEGGYACPLCGFSREARDAVYTHLVLGHRKRAISSALLEQQANGTAIE